MSEWSHLPNAAHIDWVLASLKKYPDLWAETWYTNRRTSYYNAAWNAARSAAIFSERVPAWQGAYDATNHRTRWATRDTILALIAYDDCDQYLSMTSEELRAWALMTEHPAAILLLPMVVVREQIEQLSAA
jgi:hypothetical protein